MKHMVLVVTIFSILSAAAFAEEDEINWTTTWDEAAEASAESSKPVLILFTDPQRCPPCRRLEATTLKDGDVADFIDENFVPLVIVTSARETRDFLMEFNFKYIPTIIVIDVEKNEITRTAGYKTPGQFIEFMKSAVEINATEKPAIEKKGKEQNGSNTLIYIIISLVVLAGIVYFMSRNRRTQNKGK